MRTVDAVALLNGIDMAIIFPIENAAVVLPCFHHHCKIRQLIGTVINVQTVDVVFQNALCRIALAVTGTLINLHQHIKGVYEDMPEPMHGSISLISSGSRAAYSLRISPSFA